MTFSLPQRPTIAFWTAHSSFRKVECLACCVLLTFSSHRATMAEHSFGSEDPWSWSLEELLVAVDSLQRSRFSDIVLVLIDPQIIIRKLVEHNVNGSTFLGTGCKELDVARLWVRSKGWPRWLHISRGKSRLAVLTPSARGASAAKTPRVIRAVVLIKCRKRVPHVFRHWYVYSEARKAFDRRRSESDWTSKLGVRFLSFLQKTDSKDATKIIEVYILKYGHCECVWFVWEMKCVLRIVFRTRYAVRNNVIRATISALKHQPSTQEIRSLCRNPERWTADLEY